MYLLSIALTKISDGEGSTWPSSLYGSGVDQGNEERRCMQDFLLLPQEFESFPSDLLQARWPNLVYVEYL